MLRTDATYHAVLKDPFEILRGTYVREDDFEHCFKPRCLLGSSDCFVSNMRRGLPLLRYPDQGDGGVLAGSRPVDLARAVDCPSRSDLSDSRLASSKGGNEDKMGDRVQ